MLNPQEMRSLEHCFTGVTDPRRGEGRRRRLPVMQGIAAGATLCGMEDYKAMPDRANALGQKACERFGCRRENGFHMVPSQFVIRDCLVRIEAGALDRALKAWTESWARGGVQAGGGAQAGAGNGPCAEALTMDGKTMKNAIDAAGHQTHIMSVVGHDTKRCCAQKSRNAASSRT